MSAEANAHPFRVHHFESAEKQAHAARLGMWLFLSTEILLFAGLFVAYGVYRYIFQHEFAAASSHLDVPLGTIETIVLISSSLSVAMALHYVRARKKGLAVAMLVFTIVAGLAFLGLHSIEYIHEFKEGIYPGKYYQFHELPYPGANMFYTLYFLMTGLHGTHVLVGVVILSVLTVRTAKGHFDERYNSPLELGGMYWHLVDLIWIFLYPLLYLLGVAHK